MSSEKTNPLGELVPASTVDLFGAIVPSHEVPSFPPIHIPESLLNNHLTGAMPSFESCQSGLLDTHKHTLEANAYLAARSVDSLKDIALTNKEYTPEVIKAIKDINDSTQKVNLLGDKSTKNGLLAGLALALAGGAAATYYLTKNKSGS